jgi:heat-inducible transcriptional repressor
MSTRDPPQLEDLDGIVLNEREQQVLQAIVETHIASADPVGSKALADGLSVSSATVRNVMGALHRHGLIDKAHHSAGRVPTPTGLRFYVDTMLRLQAPEDDEREEIAHQLQEAGSVERALGEAGRVLARLSRSACVLQTPRPAALRLQRVEFLRLRDDAILVIVIAADGSVQNRLVEMRDASGLARHAPSAPELDRMGNWLSERVEGRSFAEVRRMLVDEHAEVRGQLDALEQQAMALGSAAIAPDAGKGQPGGLVVEGERHLLSDDNPGSLERARELLRVLEEKEQLIQLLERTDEAPGVRIFIGDENPMRELADMSVVTTSYGREGEVFGTLGVIGPVRMDYGRIVPLVELTARSISELLR